MPDEPRDARGKFGPLTDSVEALHELARDPIRENGGKPERERELALHNLVVDVVEDLLRDIRFEHWKRKELRATVLDAVAAMGLSSEDPAPSSRGAASVLLDRLAREPRTCTLYLGVENLDLPHGTVAGDAQFLRLAEEVELSEALARLPSETRSLLCAVEVTAGTSELLRECAREKAEIALGLIRQQALFGFRSRIYLDQVLFGLDGAYAIRIDGALHTGWWRKPRPIPMALTTNHAWIERLKELSNLRSAIRPGLQEAVNICIGWLDVAALSDNWRIVVTALFSAMEAILVPESRGDKGARVAVRGIAVHLAADTQVDFLQGADAYRLRNALSHGGPTDHMILPSDAPDFAHRLQRWAFDIFTDYLTLAVREDADSVADLALSIEPQALQACDLLTNYGFDDVADRYRTKRSKAAKKATAQD